MARSAVSVLILNPLLRKEWFDGIERAVTHKVETPWRIVDPFGLQPDTDPDTALPKRAIDAAYGGPETWTTEEILGLLHDRVTLVNFALLIHDLMPDWWIDALERETDGESTDQDAPRPALPPDAK
jgi:hypothetical protein